MATIELDTANAYLAAEDEATLVLNMGPQHPSTHGVLRLVLKTDGEVVTHADPDPGYLHRCAEKIGERVPYVQYGPYTDRLDYLAAMNNNWAYARAVEKLMGLEVPARAEYIRVIVAELGRIASHLVAVGTFGLDVGAFTPFLLAFRQREMILSLFEALCGARLTFHYVRIGGVAADIPQGFIEDTHKFLDQFDPLMDEFNELLSYNQIFIKRTADVGVILPEQAIAWGLTGPMLRASGVDWDLRRDEPYGVYPELEFKVIVGRGEKGTVGDSWDRYFVRILEMYESAKLVRQALKKLPEGPTMGKVPKVLKPPPGEVYVRSENPRGELGFYIVSDGSTMPLRMRVRAPSFCNLSILSEIVKNMYVADLVAFLGTFDLVMGEVDR